MVLPAKSVYERDGTVVNLEGRFLTVNAAPVDGGTSERDDEDDRRRVVEAGLGLDEPAQSLRQGDTPEH